MELTQRQQRLLEIIADAARAGRVCPTNKAIAEMDGLASASAVADAISRLQRKGVIEVERYNRARIVCLPDQGLVTAEPEVSSQAGQAPHWRDRKPGVDYSNNATRPRPFPPPAPWRKKWPWTRWYPARCQYLADPLGASRARKCGGPVVKGSPYCASHHLICHSMESPDADG